MAAKVSFKSMDYFKYRKYIIDKDDPSSCSKEVTSLCACVHALNKRNDMFEDGDEEWTRMEEIFKSYKQILVFKRVEAVDVKLKSGWWGDQKSGLSVGKVKPNMLKDVLVAKCEEWYEKNGMEKKSKVGLDKSIEGSGVYVFKHKEKDCFQKAFTCSDNIFMRCGELFKGTFEGTVYTPLGCLLIVSLVNDWEFYFIPSESNEEILKVLENDVILKHDTLWPHGLNLVLSIETPFDVKHFRESCVRHNWPPEKTFRPAKIDNGEPGKLRIDPKRLKSQPPTLRSPVKNTVSPTSPIGRPKSARPNSMTNSIAVSSSFTSKSPASSRPSTAQTKNQKAEEKALNTCKKEIIESKKPVKMLPKQEMSAFKEKRTSKSFQNFKNDNSINNSQSISTSESKLEKETPQTENENCKEVEMHLEKKKEENKESDHSIAESDKQAVSKKVEENMEDDEFFEPKPMKRSNTFTLSDTEDENQETSTCGSSLTARAVAAAKQLSS